MQNIIQKSFVGYHGINTLVITAQNKRTWPATPETLHMPHINQIPFSLPRLTVFTFTISLPASFVS